MINSTDYLRKARVPTYHSPDAFNLEKYMERDHSRAKAKAEKWGKDDFKGLVKENSQNWEKDEDSQ